jgi:hypothetical protein
LSIERYSCAEEAARPIVAGEMTTTERSARLTAALTRAATNGAPSEVEAALGRFKGDAAVGAAERAAATALGAARWDNLSYLADFLADVTAGHPPTGGESDSEEPGDAAPLGADRGELSTGAPPEGLLAHIVDMAERGPPTKGGDPAAERVTDEPLGEAGKVRILEGALAYVVPAVGAKEDLGHPAGAELPVAYFGGDSSERRACEPCASILAHVVERLERAPELEEATARHTPRTGQMISSKAEHAPTREEAEAKTRTARAGPRTPSEAERAPVREEVPNVLTELAVKRASGPVVLAEFELVDPGAAEGDYRSAQYPGLSVSIEDPSDDIPAMRGADEELVGQPTIRVLYAYPLGSAGPSQEEQENEGWIFEEAAPNGRSFTRADLARVVSARYHRIYAEEDESSGATARYVPGMFNREPSNGKFKLWGHSIWDLGLHAVTYDAAADLYSLGIDS